MFSTKWVTTCTCGTSVLKLVFRTPGQWCVGTAVAMVIVFAKHMLFVFGTHVRISYFFIPCKLWIYWCLKNIVQYICSRNNISNCLNFDLKKMSRCGLALTLCGLKIIMRCHLIFAWKKLLIFRVFNYNY